MSKINLQQITIEEVGEVPSKVPGCLEDLKCWLTKQGHFRCRLDDEFLLQFLRGCRYDVEKVKRKLQNFYTFKTLCPDYFGTVNVNRHKFRQMHDIGSICILPKPLSEVGPRIVFYRYLYSPEFMEEAIEVCLATLETLIVSDPHACVCGVVYIFDMSDITMDHILAYTPEVLKKLSIFYEKVLPFQTKGFYFMNVPEFSEHFFNLYLPSLSEELRESVFVCGQNITHISDKVPLKYLPQEYGGENGCLRDLLKEFHTVWDKHSEYFQENHKFGIKADLRGMDCPVDFEKLDDYFK